MIFSFGRFALDEGRRELRLSGRAVEMQPRMFDLLVYLVRNRERVVSKDELLSALWPDVIVTDSSIMRAVSLIRSILRGGDQPDAIQTFSRQGYRFAGELADETTPQPLPHQDVACARSAYAQGEWTQALEAYRTVIHAEQLRVDDFEHWARAALCVGKPNEAIYPLERTVAAHIQNADRVGAARAALMLTNLHLEARALPVAKGWHRRAATFLADEQTECSDHGMLIWMSSRIALFEGNLPEALEHAKNAEALARRVDDPDVEVLGLVYRGHVELATGQIRTGLVHMDEAGAATLAGTVSPWVCGIVFCSVIWAYLDRGDITRAGQWTDQFIRWCGRHAAFGFPGMCRLHRGEVLCVQGDLIAAESEINQARALLAENARYAEGDAYRVLGDIRLLRGDNTGAEEAFRRAHELGWQPLPGWAVVQAENGHVAAAIKKLQRGLKFPGWADGQRRGLLLAELARIAARAGQNTLAKQTLRDLEKSTDLRSTSGCEAMFHRARAEVALADEDHDGAIDALRAAVTIWLEVGSRINAAHVRLRLAQVLAQVGEVDDAELELSLAESAFETMDAKPMVARCEAARKAISAAEQQTSSERRKRHRTLPR